MDHNENTSSMIHECTGCKEHGAHGTLESHHASERAESCKAEPKTTGVMTANTEKISLMSSMHPKISFFFGMAVGVAVISAIGFFSLLSAFTSGSGNKLAALAKAIDEDVDIDTFKNDGNNQPTAQPATNDAPEPGVNPSKVKITSQDHVFGDKNAPLTIVEFSDFQCPFCQRFHPEVEKLINNNKGEIKWVYKHFPLSSIHPWAQKSAEASECAAEQGKFWEYVKNLFANQALFSDGYFSNAAKDLGLDQSKFDSCLSNGKYKQKVQADYQMGLEAGVSGTPGSFINDVYVSGAKPYDGLQQIVDGLLGKQ
jgi:protein-disulfide isomerase